MQPEDLAPDFEIVPASCPAYPVPELVVVVEKLIEACGAQVKETADGEAKRAVGRVLGQINPIIRGRKRLGIQHRRGRAQIGDNRLVQQSGAERVRVIYRDHVRLFITGYPLEVGYVPSGNGVGAVVAFDIEMAE